MGQGGTSQVQQPTTMQAQQAPGQQL